MIHGGTKHRQRSLPLNVSTNGGYSEWIYAQRASVLRVQRNQPPMPFFFFFLGSVGCC